MNQAAKTVCAPMKKTQRDDLESTVNRLHARSPLKM
jgi:hypothetical protein